jgi:hypothetical protein
MHRFGVALVVVRAIADVAEMCAPADGSRQSRRSGSLVNQTNSDSHVEFIGDQGEHHVVNVPGRISAVFYRPGRHPFVVHVASTGRELARGVVNVPENPARNELPVCGWITVEGICFER